MASLTWHQDPRDQNDDRLAVATSVIAMHANTSRARRVPPFASPNSPTLSHRIGALYELAQKSNHVFGSPLGPLSDDLSDRYLPRFVYFGPNTSQESIRLAVLAGFTRHDRVAVNALLVFIEGLAQASDLGDSLNLSFFPVVAVEALIGSAEESDLTEERWDLPRQPEVALLRQEILRSSYQAFVRITTTADEQPSAWVRSVHSSAAQPSHAQIFSPGDFEPWVVTFETVSPVSVAGPLNLAPQLPFTPFEVELAIPADWSQRKTDRALAGKLKSLIQHYRAYLAFGQHL